LWTDDEWDALADTSQGELLDGVALWRPTPDETHQQIKTALRTVLAGLAPAGLAVATDVEVRLANRHRRRPDLVVVSEAALDLERWHLQPAEVALVIEVVGPGTETLDRKHKPAEYSDADIPHYWRVETSPRLSLHTYVLGENTFFLETGIFRAGDEVRDPTLRWASFEVDDLTPYPS
jgi:Uma2 family endonuclease